MVRASGEVGSAQNWSNMNMAWDGMLKPFGVILIEIGIILSGVETVGDAQLMYTKAYNIDYRWLVLTLFKDIHFEQVWWTILTSPEVQNYAEVQLGSTAKRVWALAFAVWRSCNIPQSCYAPSYEEIRWPFQTDDVCGDLENNDSTFQGEVNVAANDVSKRKTRQLFRDVVKISVKIC